MRLPVTLAALSLCSCFLFDKGGSSSSSSSSSTGGPDGGARVLGDKCSVSQPGACDAVAAGATCVQPFADSPRGGVCTVTGCTMGATDCAGTGTVCVLMPSATGCLRACNVQGQDGQCGEGNACVPVGNAGSCMSKALAGCVTTATGGTCISPAQCEVIGTDGFGFCKAQCALWGTDCPTGLACYPQAGDQGGFCARGRGLNPGDACTSFTDCVDGSVCMAQSGGSRCTRLCDAAHACTGTDVCRAVPTIGASVCMPAPASGSSSGGSASSR